MSEELPATLLVGNFPFPHSWKAPCNVVCIIDTNFLV